MTILERLKGKLRAKREDNHSQYWSVLTKIAAGKLTERAADEALEALAATMELIGKNADDAQVDVELLEQLSAAEAQAQGLDEAKKHARAVAAEETQKRQRVEQLLRESQNLAKESEQNLARARGRVNAIESAQNECTMIRNKLARAGHPESQHRSADDEARNRFEQRAREIESKLDQTDRDIRSTERHVDNLKGSAPSYLGEGDAIKAELEHLQGQRERLTSELTALRQEESVRVAMRKSGGAVAAKALGGGS